MPGQVRKGQPHTLPGLRELIVGVVLMLVVCCLGAGAAPDGGAREGRPAPDFRLRSARGACLALQELRGTILVMQFGTSW